MPTQAALSGRSERTAILSTHSLYATATNGTNFPLSAYRARLHVPEAYSTAQPSVLLAASPFPRVGCWPTKPQPSILFLLSKAQLYCQLRHADHGGVDFTAKLRGGRPAARPSLMLASEQSSSEGAYSLSTIFLLQSVLPAPALPLGAFRQLLIAVKQLPRGSERPNVREKNIS